MPRSIAEVNAIRQSNESLNEPSSPGHPSAGHGRHGYDPNQPRVPAGHSDGGQWTDSGTNGPESSHRKVELDDTGEETWESVTSTHRPDGTLAEQEVINRDGSRILSQFSRDPRIAGWDERHTVVLPDGQQVTFENSGDTQTIYDANGRPISAAVWTDSGPEAQPTVQPAYYQSAPAVGAGIAGLPGAAAGLLAAAGLTLLTWLSTRNTRDGTAVLSFPADVFRQKINDKGEIEAAWVGRLTKDELGKACKEYTNVQVFTNEAAAKAKLERDDWTATGLGTEVHKSVAHKVNGKPPEFTPDEPKYPNFRQSFPRSRQKRQRKRIRTPRRRDTEIRAPYALTCSNIAPMRKPCASTTSRPGNGSCPGRELSKSPELSLRATKIPPSRSSSPKSGRACEWQRLRQKQGDHLFLEGLCHCSMLMLMAGYLNAP
jgi:hypothetical protein